MSIIIDAVRQHAEKQPTQVAIAFDDHVITYAELWIEVCLYHEIIKASHCHTLAIALDNSKAWVLADLAAMMAGLTIIPIPSFFSQSQTEHILKTADVDLILQTTNVAPGDEWSTYPSELPGVYAFKRTVDGMSQNAKITFTSGSTGQPKGVVLPQAVIDTTSRGIVAALAPLEPQRHLSVLPLATLLENIAGLYAPLLHGSSIRLPSEKTVGLSGASLDVERFTRLLNTEQADSMILVPQLLTALTTLVEFGLIANHSFKMLAVGGGRVSEHLLQKSSDLGLPVYEGYGLSECCSVLTLNLPGAHKPGSVGKPLGHAKLRVNDHGELEVKQPVMTGYLRAEPLSSDWYATGDLGYIDADGYVFITGRKKNLFITAFGRNVNPEWMEAALTQHAAIAQAVVYGEAKDHNLALLWLRFETNEEQLEQLIEAVNTELPDYAQVHRYKVMTGAVPECLQTDNGRLKRQQALIRYEAIIEDHYSANPTENRVKRMCDVIL